MMLMRKMLAIIGLSSGVLVIVRWNLIRLVAPLL